MKPKNLQNNEAVQANMELNEKMNQDNEVPRKKKITSATEANMAIQDEFYGETEHEHVVPSFIYNNIPAIKVNNRDD